MADAAALKDQGNKAFQAKEYDKAIGLFTQAINLDPKNFVLYSNRSAANAGKRQYEKALEDAEACIKINPTWSKGYARKGAALHGLRQYEDAILAYEAGLKLEDSPPLRKGLQEVKDALAALERGDGADVMGIGKMFSDPNVLGKLASNPRTAKHLADPSFVQRIKLMQANPKLAESEFGRDPRMIDVLGVLMGIDIQGFSGEDAPPFAKEQAGSSSTSPPQPTSPPPAASSSKPQPAPEPPKEEVEDVEMEDEEERKAKADAEAEKKLGAEAYKKKDFGAAVQHFEKAWELWPKDITYLSNVGAAYLEKGDYDKSIEACQKAVDEGRELRVDYKLVAKALGRIGTAYFKKGDLAEAIRFYQKSLAEHRTPDILTKLKEAEKAKAEADKLSYIDPEKASIAREEGNKAFKEGDFPSAVKAYTEAIKRAPQDPRGYNNRANAYTKLAALPEALKDAEKAIEVDPSFVKAYIRKSHVLYVMKDYVKAVEAIQQAEDHDVDGKHKAEIQAQMLKCQEGMYSERTGESEEEVLQRAMRDPEVASIMSDPIMQSILQQAQTNPAALQDHMKNPMIRQKIMKLVNAGIIKTR